MVDLDEERPLQIADPLADPSMKQQSAPCGGITPLMMALAADDQDMTRDLRECGAEEPDMTPSHPTIVGAFEARDFVDIVRHLAAGADVDTKLRRGQGVQDSAFGTPLHALAALHRKPGAYELTQLLVRKGANLDAPDAEGDSPLAHARYFGASKLVQLLQGLGAETKGPYYARFGHP